MDPLTSRVQEILTGARVVVANGAPRLRLAARHTVIDERPFNHVRGRRKSGVDCGFLVPHQRIETDVSGSALPDRRCPLRESRCDRYGRRQFFVIDRDPFRGVLGGVHGLRHNDGNRFAHVADLVGGDHGLSVVENEAAPVRERLGTGIAAVGRIGDVENVPVTVGLPFLAGQNPHHTRRLQRIGGVDAADPGMGIGRTDKLRVALSGPVEVVAEAALAGNQAAIFPSREPSANHSHTGLSPAIQ